MLQHLTPPCGTSSRVVQVLPPVVAATFVRRMRGRSQAVMVTGTDDQIYIVKLRGNSNSSGALANELIGGLLCDSLGFTVPRNHLVRISDDFLHRHPEAWFQTANGRVRPPAGLHYGSTFVGTVQGPGRPFELLPSAWKPLQNNRSQFCGMYLFDIWSNHLERRQTLFVADDNGKSLHAVFLDNGSLFGGSSWGFGNSALQAAFRKEDAAKVQWREDSVHAWLERFRVIVPGTLADVLKLVPPEWCAGDLASLERTLLQRLEAIEEIVRPFALIE